MAEFSNLQVVEDFSVGGQVDLGGSLGNALSIGPGYVDVSGVPLSVHKGILFKPTTAPTASNEGAILFLDSSTRKLTLRRTVSDGGDLVEIEVS